MHMTTLSEQITIHPIAEILKEHKLENNRYYPLVSIAIKRFELPEYLCLYKRPIFEKIIVTKARELRDMLLDTHEYCELSSLLSGVVFRYNEN